MAHFLDADRKTDYLLPPSMDDWLPEGHLARFTVEVIEQLDLSRLVQHSRKTFWWLPCQERAIARITRPSRASGAV